MKHPRRFANKGNSGFTLVEALVASAVFVAVAVPLLSIVFGSRHQDRAQDLFTATCFLAQEAKKAQVLPENPPTEITKTIKGIEWKIKWEVSGDKVQTCVATVYKGGGVIADAALLRTVQVAKE
jgi:type II secretory pathway pseudopilin PulG